MGLDEIPATTVNLKDITRGEVTENYARKDFAPSEMVAIRRVLEPQEQEAAKKRQGGKGRNRSGKSLEQSKGETHEGVIKARYGDQIPPGVEPVTVSSVPSVSNS